ncbi:hypothetical protein GWK47_052139 [Chionoecetes opilio]|uniref:Uncharacterized protein n=1 Tax=Chionoecetes opilio TaxID=41210 RepID=A0A8J4Y1N8_CHIOP|nr:hypothetical protein GWK47_052139 [Chionoecetes opilio]
MVDLINFSVEDLEDFLHNGAEGMEIKKEEVVTSDTEERRYQSRTIRADKVDESVRTRSGKNERGSKIELLLRNKGEEKEVRRPVRSLIKPRDIRMLNLSDLQGIETEGRLKVFFSQVESCSEDLEERKRILMARVDPPLALYIQNALSQVNFKSWDALTYWLYEELTDNNVDRILNSISEVKYDWLEDPQDFATKLKCKYAILEAKSKHPGEIPRRDKIIKTKLLRGLPSQIKAKLEYI